VPHDVTLISTIAVGLAFGFAGGFAAARFGVPPIVGYLLAGIAIGPFTPGLSRMPIWRRNSPRSAPMDCRDGGRAL